MSEVRISDVKLGDRHRHDLGDVDALVRSIQKFGLLHPIVVTPETLLIVGRRRLEAYRRMGRTEIPARILPVCDILRGELEENTCRKDFTPAEMVASGRAIKLEEQKAAKERMVAAHASPGKFPEQERGRWHASPTPTRPHDLPIRAVACAGLQQDREHDTGIIKQAVQARAHLGV